MPTFTYKAMDPQFRFISGEIEAGSLREVSSELEKLGYVVLDTATGKNTAAKPSFSSSSETSRRLPASSSPVMNRCCGSIALYVKVGIC